jgi:hypothetical protein
MTDPQDRATQTAEKIAALESWRANLDPINSALSDARSSTVNFALAGLKAGYFLNGGAAVAVPVFAGFAEPLEASFLWWALIAFVLGLVMTAFANLLAYFNGLKMQVALKHRHSEIAHRLKGETALEQKEKDESQRAGDKVDQFLRWAIASILAALLAFVAGVSFGGYAFLPDIGGA